MADEQRNTEKNTKVKNRNAARKQWRKDNPKQSGKKLKKWPLENNNV